MFFATPMKNGHVNQSCVKRFIFGQAFWAFLSNVFMSFSSGKYRTNNAKTKQHWNIYVCAKDRVTQTTDANVGKGATVRVNIDKEVASGVKKKNYK